MTMSLLLQTIHQCVHNKFSIDQSTLQQISKLFNLNSQQVYGQNLYNSIIQKFKNKLFDLFHTQGENYKDYLKLPKFNQILRPQTQQKLKQLFNTIWDSYQQKIHYNQYQAIPQFHNLKQIEEYHLDIFNSYRSSKWLNSSDNKMSMNQVNDKVTSHTNNRNNVNNILSQQQQQQNIFPPIINSNNSLQQIQYKRPIQQTAFYMLDSSQPNKYLPNNNITSINNNINNNSFMNNNNMNNNNMSINNNRMIFPKIQDQSKFINNNINTNHNNSIWSNSNNNNQFHFPLNNNHKLPSEKQYQSYQSQPNSIFYHQNHQPFKYNPNRQNYQHKQLPISKAQSSSPIHQQQSTIHISSNEDQYLAKLQSYMFIQCACQGTLKKQSTAPYMICKNCNFYYHYQCLLMDQKITSDICPCCKLKQGTNLFVKIHPEPYGKRWCKNLKIQKLSLFLTQKQIENIHQQKLNCKPSSLIQYQLRFLKITKRNKSSKNGQQGTSRKFNHLPLPTDYVDKIQPYNQFQISLRQTQQDNIDQCSYFFAIFMVQKFSQKTLTQDLFSNINDQNSVGEQFIKKFLAEDQQTLTIKLKDPTSQRKVLYPVRGNRCEHPEVFDYLSILEYYKEYGQKLKEKHCTICEVQIDSMLVDRFLLQKINKYERQNADKEFESMRYYGQGRVQFVQEEEDDSVESDPNDLQPQEELEQESQQLSC